MATDQHVLMTDKPLWQWSLSELSAGLGAGTLTATGLLDHLLARIEQHNPRLNALVSINPEAHSDAAESDARWRAGLARSPLDGIPVAIKDNINVRGMVTSWGNQALAAGAAADFDELPVERLRNAGMVILGKTNVPEFTLEGYTDNPVYGATRNPWNCALTPGGSSGGAVAAVAAGLVPCALGTDGGGSIRRPASHTGLIGFKPSIGKVARHHSLPHIMLDFEVIGPITRCIDDTQLMMDCIAGPDPRDRHSLLPPCPDGMETRSLRIRYVPRFGDHPLDPEIEASVNEAASRLRALGHQVTEGPLPFSLAFIDQFWPMLGAVAVATLFERYPQAETVAAPKWAEMAARGRAISAPQYLDALDRIDRFRSTVTEAYQHFDLIMTPSAAALPWPATAPFPTTIAGQVVGPRGHAIYTGWVNACGHPGLNLPASPSREGLPIGFQLVGGFNTDQPLIDVGRQYMRSLPGSFLSAPVEP